MGLHKKDLVLLQQIQAYFCVGRIYQQGSGAFQLHVESVKDLAKVLDHFEEYPLTTQKRADYELFKQAIRLMEQKEHLKLY
jgi:hypothetical protein